MPNEDNIYPAATDAENSLQSDPQPAAESIISKLTNRVQAWLNVKGDVTQAEFLPLPLWLWALFAITLLSMSSQIKLPFSNGRLALSDLTVTLTFLAVLWCSWRKEEKIFYPLTGFFLLALFPLVNFFAASGMNGAFETAKLYQRYFCGFLVLSYFLRRSPFAVALLFSLGLFSNLLLAIAQTNIYGYGSIQAPADVLALPLGFGKALTGFFRSRMALSFYFAVSLTWLQPQWLGRNPGLLRCLLVLLATVLLLCFIPHGMMLVLCMVALLIASMFLHKRALLLNLLAILLVLFSLTMGQENTQRDTVLGTLTPCKSGAYAGELKTCHLDFLAALRMASLRPCCGVGAGRYQANIGRCYGELPNPSYNDIDSDTQAGWGILASTVGFPLTFFLALAMLGAMTLALCKYYQQESSPASQQLGAASALFVLFAGFFISNPMIGGLCWLLTAVVCSAIIPHGKELRCKLNELDTKGIIIGGILLGLLLLPLLMRKAVADPLQNASLSGSSGVRRAAATHVASNFVSHDSDFFLVVNASQVKEFTPPFEKHQDSQAADKLSLRIPDGKGVPPEGKEPAMEHGGALFEIELPKAQRCKIWLRTWWDGACGNTVNLQIDDEPRSITIGNDGTYHTWHWLESPRVYELEAGKHQIRVLNREDGIAFDQILITSDMEYFPQDIEEQP
ncbi:MAG: hypothetical protein GX946_01130 [Oligosphaeraceae bacterium]|nr:hypothetical protein [Oligosphaeraceae bacterium]